MTAEALPMDFELPTDGPDDPDATWVDLLRGRRGRPLPEAATACLPAARTQCLPEPAGPRREPRRLVPVPSEHTCLGDLVPSDVAVPAYRDPDPAGTADTLPPRSAAPARVEARAHRPLPPSVDALPDTPTVAEYHEPLIERVDARVREPVARISDLDLPALPAGATGPAGRLPALAEASASQVVSSPWSAGESAPRRGTPALAGRPANDRSDPRVATQPPSSGARAEAPSASSWRALDAGEVPASNDLSSPHRGSAAAASDGSSPGAPPPSGPGGFLSPPPDPRAPRPRSEAPREPRAGSGPVVQGMDPDALKAGLQARVSPSIPAVPTWAAQRTQVEGPGVWIETEPEVPAKVREVVPSQRHVPTNVGPLPSQSSVVAYVPRKRSFTNEVLPFALVLIAISLATAAIVGAYF